jgi:hypothetical protein
VASLVPDSAVEAGQGPLCGHPRDKHERATKAWQGSFILLLTTLGCRTTATMSAANLLAYSEQFANPTWGAGNVTVVDNAAIAPDRSQTAARLTETATYSWHGLNQGFEYISGTVVYVSVSMKAGERTKGAAELRPRERAVLSPVRCTGAGSGCRRGVAHPDSGRQSSAEWRRQSPAPPARTT